MLRIVLFKSSQSTPVVLLLKVIATDVKVKQTLYRSEQALRVPED